MMPYEEDLTPPEDTDAMSPAEMTSLRIEMLGWTPEDAWKYPSYD